MASNVALLPKQWRKTLPQQIKHLPFPYLSMAFDEANTILQARSEAEVVEIAAALWQKLLEKYPTLLSASIIPRSIYLLYSNKVFHDVPSEATLNEHLAAAILIELTRVCGVCTKEMNQASWQEAATAVANAHTLADWLYFLNSPPIKAKTKKWTYKSLKKTVLSYYEDHKSDFKSLADAAEVIHSKNLVPLAPPIIHKWLEEYVKEHGP